MSRLIFNYDLLANLRESLLQHKVETCAMLFARPIMVGDRIARVLVREAVYPDAEEYVVRTETRAELKPAFIARVTKEAILRKESLIFVHTHPFDYDRFSPIDDQGEAIMKEFLESRSPGVRHGAVLITPNATLARELGTGNGWEVAGVGPTLAWGKDVEDSSGEDRFDRQIRAFGATGQRRLRKVKVGIVGLGGTGSVVLQQLAHLGVSEFMLMDPDTVEVTNLNRLVGAVPSDVGLHKVEVAKRSVSAINPSANFFTTTESVLIDDVARSLADVDFVFCCTDSHGSRAVLNQVAYQYLIPMIDMGVVIVVSEGAILNIAAKVQFLGPGVSCLTCGNSLNPEMVRRDLMTEFQRQQDPYIQGAEEPAPSVITLNSVAASYATTMFLSVVLGVGPKARYINYDGLTGVSRAARSIPNPACIVCSPRGTLGRGDEWPLAARRR